MTTHRQLPVIEGSLGRDGAHRKPCPADVSGRFASARKMVFGALIASWAVLPWITIGHHPAVFLDIERRELYLFGSTFNSQDVWLVFFLLSGIGFALLAATAVLGRVWCGWACPQTVFLEGLFRPIERLVNGPRNVAMRRAKEPFGWSRAWRLIAIQTGFLVAALLVAHVVLAYFVSLPVLYTMMRASPSDHVEAFAWMAVTTAVFYGNFAFFREQTCVVVCPYGRLQSVLIDDDSIVIGYDETRGEPRGKASAAAGNCVDCGRCVVVCPTGIDIRDGLQLDCIACTACVDACDEVMGKLERPLGLIRYDSSRGFRGEVRRFWRPRLAVYGVMLVVGVVVASFAFRSREQFEANLIRLPGAPYTREDGVIRNAFELHLVNKRSIPQTYSIEPADDAELHFVVPMTRVDVASLGSFRVPVFVSMQQSHFTGDRPLTLRVRVGAEPVHEAHAQFLGSAR